MIDSQESERVRLRKAAAPVGSDATGGDFLLCPRGVYLQDLLIFPVL